MLLVLPTATRWTASKFLRDCSSFQVVLPGESGCNRSGVPDAWHEMHRACPGRLARKIGCTCVLKNSKSSPGAVEGAADWPLVAVVAAVAISAARAPDRTPCITATFPS